MSFSSLFHSWTNARLTIYFEWKKRKKEDNGRIPTGTGVRICFTPYLKTICCCRHLGSEETGQIRRLGGGAGLRLQADPGWWIKIRELHRDA